LRFLLQIPKLDNKFLNSFVGREIAWSCKNCCQCFGGNSCFHFQKRRHFLPQNRRHFISSKLWVIPSHYIPSHPRREVFIFALFEY